MAKTAAAEQTQTEIADLVATLAGRQAANGTGRALSGPERAAVLMLALGDQYGDKIWKLLDDDELRTLSVTMSTLGTVEAEAVESLLLEFVGQLSASGSLLGNYDATERLLQKYLPNDRVSNIMEEMRRPAVTCGRSSPTCRSRCSPIISRTNTRRPWRWCCRRSGRSTRRACSPSCRRRPPSTWSCACSAWRRCRRTCSSGSRARCAPN